MGGFEGMERKRKMCHILISKKIKISQIGEIGLGDLLHRECFLCK